MRSTRPARGGARGRRPRKTASTASRRSCRGRRRRRTPRSATASRRSRSRCNGTSTRRSASGTIDPGARWTVRACPGQNGLSSLSVFHSKSVSRGVFVWVHRTLYSQKMAVSCPGSGGAAAADGGRWVRRDRGAGGGHDAAGPSCTDLLVALPPVQPHTAGLLHNHSVGFPCNCAVELLASNCCAP